MSRTSSRALQETYTDPHWRARFLKLWRVTSLLRSSIISKNYKIHDDINSALFLTDEGTAVFNYLARTDKVPVKEARLLCLLVFAYGAPLVDVIKTDLDALIGGIAKQMDKREIQHPYVFGRSLYDRMNELFHDERDYLNEEDTIKLLEGTPVGVFQVDRFVTGPFGVLESAATRNLPPTTKPPLQHCIDPGCFTVHSIRLSTSHEATINQSFSKIYDYLEKTSGEPADWSTFIADIAGGTASSYDDNSLFAVVYGLGELLSLDEMRTLLMHMLSQGAAKKARVTLESRGYHGNSDKLCKNLEHAELMQLLLLQPDETLVAAIDELVLSGGIHVPSGEVRTLKVHRNFAQGAWALRPEISSSGFRSRSVDRQLAILRLRRLVVDLYALDNSSDKRDLEWQLRNIRGANVLAQREEYLRKNEPAEIVERLVLRSRESLDKAHELLALGESSELTDRQVIDRLLWRLGFNIVRSAEPNSDFWRLHKSISDLAHTSAANSAAADEAMSNAAGSYFPCFEELLEDTLIYSTWCLLVDHVTQPNPFMYDPTACRDLALSILNAEISDSESPDRLGAENTIYPLINGFSILHKKLVSLGSEVQSGSHTRDEFPEYVANTELKRFPFARTIPFLNLTEDSRARVVANVKELHSILAASNINHIRNNLLHYRRSVTDPSVVSNTLDMVRDAIARGERSGMVRSRYERVSRSEDEWGRSITTLASISGGSVEVSRPTPYDWLGMPGLGREQYLFHCAVFDEPNEMLRFAPMSQSSYAKLWDGFPVRPVAPRAAIAKQAQADGTGDIAVRVESDA